MSNGYPSSFLPVVPAALAPIIGDKTLPERLCLNYGFEQGTNLSELTAMTSTDFPRGMLGPLIAIIKDAVYSRRLLIDDAAYPLAEGYVAFGTASRQLSVRTLNALLQTGIRDEENIASLTPSDLINTPGLGVVGLLETAALVESLPKSYDSVSYAVPKKELRVSRKLNSAAKQLAAKKWASKVFGDDPRLRNQLLAIEAINEDTNVKDLAQSLVDRPYPTAVSKSKVREINKLIKIASEYRGYKLKNEVRSVISSLGGKPRNIDIVCARIGGDGKEPLTLDEVGKTYGITRERVRQIEERLMDALPDTQRIWLPVLDKTLSLMSSSSPITEPALMKLLKDKNLIWGDFNPTAIMKLAEVFGRQNSLIYDPAKGLIARKDFLELIPKVHSVAVSMITHWGASNLELLKEELAKNDINISDEQLIEVLNQRNDIVWLDYKEKWFWLKSAPKNRILNYITKILSVAGTIPINDLRNGTGRWHRVHGYRLPKKVLIALCLSTGLYKFDGEKIIGDERLPDWRQILGENERKIVAILFQNNYLMRRTDLEEQALRAGVGRESFYVLIGYSPVIERYAIGVYGLRGAPVTAAQIEAIIPPTQRKTKIFKDNGWTRRGTLWLGYKVSVASATSGVVGVPSTIASLVTGTFRLYTETDEIVGSLTVRNYNLWGLSPYFRRWGVEGGDYIVIEIDNSTKKAVIYSGDEELIGRFREQESIPAEIS